MKFDGYFDLRVYVKDVDTLRDDPEGCEESLRHIRNNILQFIEEYDPTMYSVYPQAMEVTNVSVKVDVGTFLRLRDTGEL